MAKKLPKTPKAPKKPPVVAYALKRAVKKGEQRSSVPFATGVFLGGFTFLFLGLYLGRLMSPPTCEAQANFEAAGRFCSALVSRTVEVRCKDIEDSQKESCREFITQQASTTCDELVGMKELQDEALNSCQ